MRVLAINALYASLMKLPTLRPSLLALTLIAAFATIASAPASADTQSATRPNPAQMAQRHAERMATLKAKLNLSASQESAWQEFAAAMRPPAHPPKDAASRPARGQRPLGQPPKHGKRHEAIQKFRNQLNAQQQSTFDEHFKRGPGGRSKHKRPPSATN